MVDAVGMYANINTLHAFQTMESWLYLYEQDLPPADFPLHKVLTKGLLNISMACSIFVFGNH
jgi:hypothetical protein